LADFGTGRSNTAVSASIDEEEVFIMGSIPKEVIAKIINDNAISYIGVGCTRSNVGTVPFGKAIPQGKTAQTRLGVKRQLNDHNIDDAMQRFENYERKMDDLEGQIEAYDMGQRTLADEIAELEVDDSIDADLAELKARMKGESGPAPVSEEAASNDQSANG